MLALPSARPGICDLAGHHAAGPEAHFIHDGPAWFHMTDGGSCHKLMQCQIAAVGPVVATPHKVITFRDVIGPTGFPPAMEPGDLHPPSTPPPRV